MRKFIFGLIALFAATATIYFTSCEKEVVTTETGLLGKNTTSAHASSDRLNWVCDRCGHYHGTLAGWPTPNPSNLDFCCFCGHAAYSLSDTYDGKPIYLGLENAEVTYTNIDNAEDVHVYYTDENGHWDDGEIADGTYDIVITLEGYEPGEGQVTIVDGVCENEPYIQLNSIE